MIIIYGHGVDRKPHPRSDRILGSGAANCPMRGCRGVCKVYIQQRYCHMYWIPCCNEGAAKEVVSCTSCRANFKLEEYQQWRSTSQVNGANAIVNLLVGATPNKKPEVVAKECLNAGSFAKAEFVAKNGLKNDPRNINLMCQLDVALNGLGKAKESDKLASTIVYHWETHCRNSWITTGRREERAAFPRFILKQGLPDIRIEAKQYFEPQSLEDGRIALYKIIVYPKEELKKKAPVSNKMSRGKGGNYSKLSSAPVDDKRIFKLVQEPNAGGGFSYYVKECSNMEGAISYDRAISYRDEENQQPDIRKVATDVASFLIAIGPMEDVSGQREVLVDGNADIQFFSACENDPRLSRVQVFVANSDWRAVRDFFGSLQADERPFWASVVSTEIARKWSKETLVGKMSQMLDDWLAFEPKSVDCRVIRLETYTSWAWNARTAKLGCAVSRARSQEFRKRLMEAAKEFKEAKTICAGEPLLYSTGMTIVRGLGNQVSHVVTIDDCKAGLRDLSSDPHFYRAHWSALQYYCRKWHGSHDQMFEYARSITAQLPDGHPLWVLIPMAHWERALIQPPDGYWQRPEVKKELLDAYHRAFPPGIASTVTSAPHKLAPEWSCRNYFAYCMVMTQQYEEARHQIRVIGKRPTENLWLNYQYYALMLGFDVESGAAAALWESADHDMDIPVVQAEVISREEGPVPQAQVMLLPEVV